MKDLLIEQRRIKAVLEVMQDRKSVIEEMAKRAVKRAQELVPQIKKEIKQLRRDRKAVDKKIAELEKLIGAGTLSEDGETILDR